MSVETSHHFNLDVGTGEGSSQGAYSDSTWIGVDANPEVVARISRKYHNNSFVVAEAEHLPFDAGQFREVVASHVLEHVQDPADAVGELYRVTAREGKIRIAVPASRYEKLMNWVMNGSYREMHLNSFSPESLVKSVEAVGLKVELIENRKWWAALSILGRSALFKLFGSLFEMHHDTGLWELKGQSIAATAVKKAIETAVYVFEKVAHRVDGKGLGKYANAVFPFEHYLEAKKR